MPEHFVPCRKAKEFAEENARLLAMRAEIKKSEAEMMAWITQQVCLIGSARALRPVRPVFSARPGGAHRVHAMRATAFRYACLRSEV